MPKSVKGPTKGGRRPPSSSDSEEDGQDLMNKTLSGYNSELGLGGSQTCTQLKVKANCCLICLDSIRRVQATWNCRFCFCMFHLVCIQQWAKDGVQLRNTSVLSEHLFPSMAANWSCPACRGDYSKLDTPRLYKCFCGKQVTSSISLQNRSILMLLINAPLG